MRTRAYGAGAGAGLPRTLARVLPCAHAHPHARHAGARVKHRGLMMGAGAIALAVAGVLALRARKRAKLARRLTASEARAALAAEHGNVARAAMRLGVAEKTLHLFIKNHAPDLRGDALKMRLARSRTGYGRPPYKRGSKHLLP